MVVGRRRVAAASVATAYALHVYVLPNTIFDRPKPAIPPLSTHPHCPKVSVHSCSGYFSSVLVPRPFLSIFATLPLSLYRLSRSSTRPFQPSVELHVLFSYTYTIPPSHERDMLGSAGKRRAEARRGEARRNESSWTAPRRAAPRRAIQHSPSLTLVYLCLSTPIAHILFLLLRLSTSFAHTTRSYYLSRSRSTLHANWSSRYRTAVCLEIKRKRQTRRA